MKMNDDMNLTDLTLQRVFRSDSGMCIREHGVASLGFPQCMVSTCLYMLGICLYGDVGTH